MHSKNVFIFLLYAASAGLFDAFRVKKEIAEQIPPLTRIHFDLPDEVRQFSTSLLEQDKPECGTNSPSPYWMETSGRNEKDLLKVPSGDAAWDAELAVLLKEDAIESTWSKAMEVWDCKATNVATMSKALLSNTVPGLDGVSFMDVFETLHKEGCPVWILGGSIRDLLVGKNPADIDTSALCEVPKLRRIIHKKGWQVYANFKYSYYEIGTRGAEDGMEGKSIDTLYTHPSVVDWTANMLLLDPMRTYVIDPSGRGIYDAKAFRLYPATPKTSTNIDWDAWQIWKGQETQPRYYRYLKFRLRGWQPYDLCFRYFMADEIVDAIQKELTDPHPQYPMWLIFYHLLEDASKRTISQKFLLDVFEEDLTRGYFEKGEGTQKKCGAEQAAKASLSSQFLKHASALQMFKKTLVDGCKKPPKVWREIATKKKEDIDQACKLIYGFYKWTRGGAYKQYKEGAAVYFKSYKGDLLKGFVKKIHTAKKQIDWSYDLVDSNGNIVQAKATSKRVLEREEE